MAASVRPSIKVVKQFTYLGSTHEFSNRYYFDNAAPADATKWGTFSDAVTAAEKALYPSAQNITKIIETVGYDAGSEVPVYQKTYNLTGTLTPGANLALPGDVAVLTRYSTSARSTKNHPIYGFNYYHAVISDPAIGQDNYLAAQKTAYETYAAAWIAGFSDGSLSHHRCVPSGNVCTGYLVATRVTHRDFPRG